MVDLIKEYKEWKKFLEGFLLEVQEPGYTKEEEKYIVKKLLPHLQKLPLTEEQAAEIVRTLLGDGEIKLIEPYLKKCEGAIRNPEVLDSITQKIREARKRTEKYIRDEVNRHRIWI